MFVVFFAAGLLEVISILFRPVSLSFRLYGNVFAGETMLETMAQVPYIAWFVQIPLLSGIARRVGSGIGVHVADGGIHAADLPASRGRIRRARVRHVKARLSGMRGAPSRKEREQC